MRVTAIDIGLKNFAFAHGELVEDSCDIRSVGVEDLTGHENPNIYRNLISYLNRFRRLWEVTDVFLIEQQLNRMNVQATKLACHTQAYFMNHFPDKFILEFPSSLKTKHFGFCSKNHRDRKLFAISKVKELYADTDPVLWDWIDNLRKKDDVCDCILMCVIFPRTRLWKK